MRAITRRHFLTTSTGLAGILATGIPPARGQQREISYLCWNNFAPALGQEAERDRPALHEGHRDQDPDRLHLPLGPQQPAKYAAEVQTQAGHDLVEMRMHFPWLYEPQLADVSDMVAELEKKYGKALSSGYESAHVKGVWRAVPMYHGLLRRRPTARTSSRRPGSRSPTPGRTSTRSARS